MSEVKNLLVLPRLRVQNANAISSPMTWGFPAMSAFVGLMHALERKLAEASLPVSLGRVGVICHDFEARDVNITAFTNILKVGMQATTVFTMILKPEMQKRLHF